MATASSPRRRTLAATIAVACTASLPSLAAAQVSADPAPPAVDDVSSSNDIVVTAQKRAQSVNDIGLTIDVATGQELVDKAVVSVSDLEVLTPNLSIAEPNGPGGNPAIFLRGVGLNDFSSNNNGPIAVYADEAYRSNIIGQNFTLYDIDRVEILKGPQGTLFGRNATGGAIRVITNKPELGKFGGSASASYAEFGTRSFQVALNAPIGENAAIRVAGLKADSDGYIKNLSDGTNSGGYDYTAWRAQAYIEPALGFDLLLAAEGTHVRNGAPGVTFQGLLDPLGQPCAISDAAAGRCADTLGYSGEGGFFEANTEFPSSTDTDAYFLSAVANVELGPVTLTSVSAFEDIKSIKIGDDDVSPANALVARLGVKSDAFSQELRAFYEGGGFRATLGAFYFTEALSQDQSVDLFRVLRPFVEAADPVTFPGGFDPNGLAIGAPTFFGQIRNHQTTKVYALFGQAEFDVTDSLRLIAGLRYNDESRDFKSDVVVAP